MVEGVVIEYGKTILTFDPQSSRRRHNQVFITHAHDDHVAGFLLKSRKYATPQTLEIFNQRRSISVNNFVPIRMNETIQVEGLEVSTHNAGHMLGSAQFQVRTPSESIVYTGDINCIDTLTTQAVETIKCDALIIEATYGHPAYVFPRRQDTYVDIVKWAVDQLRASRTPVFHVYSAGKAQEIIRLFNLFTRVVVVCHPVISRISETYRSSGLKLDYLDVETEDGGHALRSGGCIYVTPSAAPLEELRRAAYAIVTGWAVRYRPRSVDAAFPLSSHADFIQLMSYVKHARPKQVYTLYGFQDTLAELISRKLGVKAQTIAAIGQRKLKEFL